MHSSRPTSSTSHYPQCYLPVSCRGVLKGRDFFLLRTPLKDRPKGPPTANRHQPPTTNRHQPPPTASGDQPPTANRHQPPITNHQPPPTATNRQLPTANRQPPPTANRQPPPTVVEHMECPRAFLGKPVLENFFFLFFPLRTPLVSWCLLVLPGPLALSVAAPAAALGE